MSLYATDSCPICDAAPRWRNTPDGAGLYICTSEFPGHYLTVLVPNNSKTHKDVRRQWFGPIPNPPEVTK